MPVIKQHYIPQFIIRNFADENELLTILDKQSFPVRSIISKSSAILFENDIYETRNLDGTYFDRNIIENKFAQIEGYISNILRAVSKNLFNRRRLSSNEEAAFALFIALQLVRLPWIREIIENSPKAESTSASDKDLFDKAIYRMMLFSRKNGFDFLKANGLDLSEEAKDELKGESLSEYIASFILSECAIYVLVAPCNSSYILTDMPILIDQFSDAKYIFPVAPQIAICCCLFDKASKSELGGFIKAEKEWIEKINTLLFDKSKRWIICNKNDCPQISNRLKTRSYNDKT